MASIRPLGDHILIERLKAEDKTAGGIVLPDTAKEKPAEGTVIAVGEGRLLESGERVAFQVKKGDRVIFSSYAGSTVKYQGHEYLIMREEDVLAVVK
jgi:chaperonin GroES